MAAAILKQEYIGIDIVIDTVVSSIHSWYVFPELQEFPVVVNLWGMTGTGKTSLVYRLCELIGMDDKLTPVVVGRNNHEPLDPLQEILRNQGSEPFVLLFDEFQRFRTLNSEGEEIADLPPMNGTMWTLLDSGKVSCVLYSHELDWLSRAISLYSLALSMGVKGEKGCVTHGADDFIKVMSSIRRDHWGLMIDEDGSDLRAKFDKSKRIPLLPVMDRARIYHLNPSRFEAEFQMTEFVESLDEQETLQLMLDTLNEGRRPRLLDCSSALIFIAGNLDEAYTMATDLNPDIPADLWDKMVKDIGPNEIRSALAKRFRPEQIARLGANHVIYPAIKADGFREYIARQVSRICVSFEERHGIRLHVSEGMLALLYSEGVYPTQGYRPTRSAIDIFLKSRLPGLCSDVALIYPDTTEIIIDASAQGVVVRYMRGDVSLGTSEGRLPSLLSQRRRVRMDDEQALVSVHEAGHVICSAYLLGEVPDAVASVTSTRTMAGYTLIDPDEPPLSRDRLMRKAAVYLAGQVAERFLFGDDDVSTGSESDITQVTRLVRRALMRSGLGGMPVAFSPESGLNETFVPESAGDIAKTTISLIRQAEKLAQDLLTEEQPLLISFSSELFRKGVMTRSEITEHLTTTGKRALPVRFSGAYKDKLQKLSNEG
jgi:hypothetical protein